MQHASSTLYGSSILLLHHNQLRSLAKVVGTLNIFFEFWDAPTLRRTPPPPPHPTPPPPSSCAMLPRYRIFVKCTNTLASDCRWLIVSFILVESANQIPGTISQSAMGPMEAATWRRRWVNMPPVVHCFASCSGVWTIQAPWPCPHLSWGLPCASLMQEKLSC